jgi:hypothetical protein
LHQLRSGYMNRRNFLLDISSAALLSTANSRVGDPSSRSGRVTVGDDLLQVTILFGPEGLKETLYKVDQIEIAGLDGDPWAVEIEDMTISPQGRQTKMVKLEGRDPARRVDFEGDCKGIGWRLTYAVSGLGRITKFLSLASTTRRILRRIILWKSQSRIKPVVAKTKLQAIAGFFRQANRGLFVSLDFPYSEITTTKGLVEVSYSPDTSFDSGRPYSCHSLTFGRVRLTGSTSYGHDIGEVVAMDTYVQERFRPRFNRPMFVSSSIVNRYTQVRKNVIFYSMKNQPTLRFNRELLRRDLKLMPKLGMEYYQVFPGVFDWAPDDPAPQTVQEDMHYARHQGVRMGDYSASNYLFCPHFNEYENSLDRPEWRILDQDAQSVGNPFCFGKADFVSFYIETVVQNCRRFGFEIHCLDFLRLKPCYAADHGHPLGRKSLYHQVSGLMRLLEAINSASPEMMTWSNSGDWSELLPKLAWSNPNLYLTDPFIRTPWQGLNMTRLLDDARREQMVSLHHTHFLPYRFFTNCQYFFCQNSPVPDIQNFEYGVLSTLAVTPNLSLSEVRPWIDGLSPAEQEEVTSFYTHWTEFVRRNYELWEKTFQAGENPGIGSVEIYGHAAHRHGFIFIINPQYWSRTVEVPLDATLGFDTSGKCEFLELYPVRRLRLTAQGPFASFGTKIPVKVGAQEVLVLEVRAASEEISAPRLFGLPGTVEQNEDAYLIKTHGPQGHRQRFALMLPPGSTPVGTASVRRDVPKQPKRQWAATPLKLIVRNGPCVFIELTFRRRRAPTELRTWSVRAGGLSSGLNSGWNRGVPEEQILRFPLFVDVDEPNFALPVTDSRADKLHLGPLANFLVAYVDQAFSEDQETWIDLRAGQAYLAGQSIGSEERLPSRKSLPPLARDPRRQWWLGTNFYLPFINSGGTEPRPEYHPQLILPMIRRNQLKRIKAWINGAPLSVKTYLYPRNPKLGCFHSDLIRSGARGRQVNKLVLFFEY